jgi:hypothetical protein
MMLIISERCELNAGPNVPTHTGKRRTISHAHSQQMLDQAAGMDSRRITDRITGVRDAITAVSDGRSAAELAERVADMTAVSSRAW